MRGIALVSLIFIPLGMPAPGATIHVPDDHATIQGAIDAAGYGDTVVVARGEYVIAEPISFKGKEITLRAADGPAETVIRMSASPVDPNRASVVIFETGETGAAAMEGFTITGGAGTDLGGQGMTEGGGVLCKQSHPTLKDCTVRGNSANGGGGISCQSASPTVANSRIVENSADHGGGVYCYNSSPTLTSCTIARNEGDGVRCDRDSSPTLTDCTITRNSGWSGGGLGCTNASATLGNCLITGNWAVRGGGLHGDRSSVGLMNCTIAENWGWSDGGGLYLDDDSSVTITNCILWGNVRGSIRLGEGSTATVTYSCVEDDKRQPGMGNIHDDPLFARPGRWDDGGTPDDRSDDEWLEGEYRLGPGSPAIDAGTREGAPPADIEGKGRPCGQAVDMGAYESCQSPFRRGDPSADGKRGLEDAVLILRYIFLAGKPTVPCLKSADWDDSGTLALSDAVSLLLNVFGTGPLPREPFAACGPDPTADRLTCDSYPPCAK